MPVFLDNLQANVAQVKTFSPKFFHGDLTGAGKKIGLLNEARNPANMPGGTPVTSEYFASRKQEVTNGDTTTTFIPVAMLSHDAWDMMDEYEIPAHAEKIATCFGPKPIEARILMQPHSLIIEKKTFPGTANGAQGGVSRKLTPCYQIFLFLTNDPTNPVHEQLVGNQVGQIPHDASANAPDENKYVITYTCDPVADLDTLRTIITAAGYTVDKQAYGDYIQNYSLYDAVCRVSELWQTSADKLLAQLFKNNVNHHNDRQGKNTVAKILRQIENYAIPLDCYRHIYADVQATYPGTDLSIMCKQNLNLLLTNTLDSLSKNKANLNHMQIPASGPVVPPSAQKLSAEQLKAVSSKEPLVLVQSGAGTGKALDLDTPILTPTGWVKIRDVQVGDDVVGSDGLAHKITGVWDHANKHAYELTFRDGSSVIACDEHLWTTNYITKGVVHERTITTEQWVNERKYKSYDFLPQVRPVEYAFGEKDLPVDPYLLGALLADGCLVNNSIQYTKSQKDVAGETRRAAHRDGYEMYDATCDSSTADQWRFRHPDDHEHVSVLKNKIVALGLNVKSRDKFIPDEYKTASVAQRKALLNGLFDGDGDVRTGRGYARFNTASDRLAEDVLQLLWSLGLSATKQRQKNKKGDYWSVNLLDGAWNPFVASEYAGKPTGTVRPARRSLVSAKRLSDRPMRCITVDAQDHLYVTKDFIVTHNSTVILSRIQYMTANGIDPNDITVLSFTNAAADHIIEKNPNVHAMTIARMIHMIYAKNFPNHELSSLDTIMNSLDIYYPNDPLAAAFKPLARNVLTNQPDAFTSMNNFVERNFDGVMAMLNTMGQTSLELEIIICYQKIETLQEPPEVQSKHLIIDEVQDNSVFEFIYALKYVEKHNESLFIVGDCSQTLYEFRASNPRALNVLEGSGVFTAFQLQVNYRSNQEILDFANMLLRNIEANQYAHIQLRANSLRPVTEQSFTDAVHFKYHELRKLTEFKDRMPTIIGNDLRQYLSDCMAKHEQVAFLAFTRQTINMIESQLKASYPGAKIAKLIPDKAYNSTIFSNFIRKYWAQVQFAPQGNLCGTIVRMVIDNIADIAGYKAGDLTGVTNKAANLLGEWQLRYQNAINAWVAQANAGQISNAQLMDLVRESLLKLEIQNNAARQAVIGERNRQRKEDQANMTADFVLSTIHSAKGLEFDHVVVMFQNQHDMPEDKKRMYYVALTRAMKSEFVIAYDTVKKPRIQADYDMIIKQLHAIAPAPQPKSASNRPKPILGVGGFPAHAPDIFDGPTKYAMPDKIDVLASVPGTDPTDPDAHERRDAAEAARKDAATTFIVPTIPAFPAATGVAS